MGENVALGELNSSVSFDLLIWDVTNPRSLQKLEPKLGNEKLPEKGALIYIVVFKMLRTLLIFESQTGFRCYLLVLDSE